MKLKFRFFFLLVLAATSCKSDAAQDSFERRAFQAPNGITETDRLGRIISTDPDDWEISPFYKGLLTLNPPFPNPTDGTLITAEFGVTATAQLTGIQVFFINSITPRRFLTAVSIPNDAFFEVVTINPAALSPTSLISDAQGLHRLLFYDNLGRLITYGDIRIQL